MYLRLRRIRGSQRDALEHWMKAQVHSESRIIAVILFKQLHLRELASARMCHVWPSVLSKSLRIHSRYLEILANTSPWLQSVWDKNSPVRKAVFPSTVATGDPDIRSHSFFLCCDRLRPIPSGSRSSIQNILLVKEKLRLSLEWQTSSERYEGLLASPTSTPSLPLFIKMFSLKSFSGRQSWMVPKPNAIDSLSTKNAKSSSGLPVKYRLWRMLLVTWEACTCTFEWPVMENKDRELYAKEAKTIHWSVSRLLTRDKAAMATDWINDIAKADAHQWPRKDFCLLSCMQL